VFLGLVHVAEKDYPRMYSFSWREDGANCSIALEISCDSIDIVSEQLKAGSYRIERLMKEFSFEKFGSDFNTERYGFENCAIVRHMEDGSVELIFEMQAMNSAKYLFASAATMHAVVICMSAIPEKEMQDPLPQFMTIETSCCYRPRSHGGCIAGEFNKDVKRYLVHHYETKGEVLREVLHALLKAAEKISGKKKRAMQGLYWAEVRNESGFLSIDCPGNSCGLNTKNTDEDYMLLKEKSEMDFGMDLICHNVDGIGQQMVLIAALAKLSDEVKKYYLKNGSG
jgi:hypothetical protein